MRVTTSVVLSLEAAQKLERIRIKYPKINISRLFEKFILEYDMGEKNVQ